MSDASPDTALRAALARELDEADRAPMRTAAREIVAHTCQA